MQHVQGCVIAIPVEGSFVVTVHGSTVQMFRGFFRSFRKIQSIPRQDITVFCLFPAKIAINFDVFKRSISDLFKHVCAKKQENGDPLTCVITLSLWERAGGEGWRSH